MDHPLRLGSRGSALALWQTQTVKTLLETTWPEREFEIEVFSTRGDLLKNQPLPAIGGKGLFTAELETALRQGRIDMAVHSLKDLPTEATEDIVIGAIPQRASAADVLVSRDGYTLATLPREATVGTSSVRRAAQLLAARPDLNIIDLRGNIDTRVRKAQDPDGPYDAIVLAHAGLERLAMLDVVSETLPFDVMLPAPGQGALAVQCRDDADSLALLSPINEVTAMYASWAERSFLKTLEGGCSLPVAAYAKSTGDGRWRLRGRVLTPDGARQINVERAWDRSEEAVRMGAELAQEALAMGAGDLLSES